MPELNPLYDKHYTCPVCDFEFVTKKVRSRFIQAVSLESDFYSDYKDENISPLLYHVNICYSCGYAFADEANRYFLPGTKELIMKRITQNWRGQTHYSKERSAKEAIEAYILAIFAGSIRKEKPIVMAGLYLRLAWMYRKQNNEQKEKECINYALKSYEDSYYQGDYKDAKLSLTRMLYLMGALYKELGNPNKAVFYFSKVIQLKDKVIEKRIIELARDQWMEMRQEIKIQRAKEKANKQSIEPPNNNKKLRINFQSKKAST
ncbi:DUF2225 domain-containing protein [Bacillus solimangrovi]|uniref:Uncharacterized protein n=1 Tax=Bacillus solimangrovi TaxID=1305675 RepID=A0A1E5LEG7_9BACI|nr:DUF2225 domain-containing protein [Bacillus solimangrovi]OEH92472.1 hypothetical protein BFG57_15545 [Bacillus solimangrovi]